MDYDRFCPSAISYQDDVIWWKHFQSRGPLWGKSPVTGDFLSQRPVTRSFDVFLDLHMQQWLSNESTRRGDLTCQSAYYDVTVMQDGLCGVMKYGGTSENYVALMGMDFLTFDRNMTRWEPNEPIHLASRLTHNAIMTQLSQSDVKATL